jgi:hypothetical protein
MSPANPMRECDGKSKTLRYDEKRPIFADRALFHSSFPRNQ